MKRITRESLKSSCGLGKSVGVAVGKNFVITVFGVISVFNFFNETE
jgi:hypothetical protein